MRRPEQLVEDHLIRRVLQRGGLVEKLAPLRAGLPDRLVVLAGRVHLVELKAPGGALRPVQTLFIERCAERGVPVPVLSSEIEVDAWLDSL